MKTETVSTDQLNEGDLVYTHGTVFRLVQRREYAGHSGCPGPVYSFTTVMLDDTRSMIPVAWRKGWTIQGNHLARWARIIGVVSK